MKVVLKMLGVCLVSAAVSTGSAANSVKVLVVTSPDDFHKAPVISVVSSDGEAYDSVDSEHITHVELGVIAQCRAGATRRKQPYRGRLKVAGYKQVGSALPPDDQLHEARSASADFRYASGKGQPHPAPEFCNTELARRLASQPDLTKYQIMAEGFTVEAPDALQATYILDCLPTGLGRQDTRSQIVALNTIIQCEASDLAAAYVPSGEMTITRVDITPALEATSLVALPNQYSGACPTTIKFAGSITATRATKVEYRFVGNNGQVSPTEELIFEAPGTQPTRELQRLVSINDQPLESVNSIDFPNQASSPPDTGLDNSHDASVISVSVPDDPEVVSPMSIGVESELLPVAVDGHIEGWQQLEILTPAAMTGNKARFSVNCDPVLP